MGGKNYNHVLLDVAGDNVNEFSCIVKEVINRQITIINDSSFLLILLYDNKLMDAC